VSRRPGVEWSSGPGPGLGPGDVVGVPLTTASARPARLTRLAATVTAIGEGLRRRAGYLDDAWVD